MKIIWKINKIYHEFFRQNETEEKEKERLASHAAYKKNVREFETDSEYRERLAEREMYRLKDKKSKTKWQEWLEHNANHQKEKRKNESFKTKRERLKKLIEYQNWKQGQSR